MPQRSFRFVRLLVAIAVALALLRTAIAVAEPMPSGVALDLRFETNRSLTRDDTQRLYGKALLVLESSNFNSSAPLWAWDTSKVLAEYSDAVARDRLIITFTEPERISTVGGTIDVREIVIGLNRPDYASSLHTVDDQGQVVGHGKYRGFLCIEFLDLVKSIALPNKTMEPTQ
jgi:hypothetical protein